MKHLFAFLSLALIAISCSDGTQTETEDRSLTGHFTGYFRWFPDSSGHFMGGPITFDFTDSSYSYDAHIDFGREFWQSRVLDGDSLRDAGFHGYEVSPK